MQHGHQHVQQTRQNNGNSNRSTDAAYLVLTGNMVLNDGNDISLRHLQQHASDLASQVRLHVQHKRIQLLTCSPPTCQQQTKCTAVTGDAHKWQVLSVTQAESPSNIMQFDILHLCRMAVRDVPVNVQYIVSLQA